MKHVWSKVCVLAGSFVLAAAAPAAAAERLPYSGAFMRIFGPAQPPYGFVRFCEHFPEECRASPLSDTRRAATPEHLSELDEVNRFVNSRVRPATDLDVYGISEYWTLPTARASRGDCEDYALLKRHLLHQRGWPSGALLLTVVRDEKGEGHAVLTVRTLQGDYILDNKTSLVKLWTETPYVYIMRQSYRNPRVWVSLDPAGQLAGVLAGSRFPPRR